MDLEKVKKAAIDWFNANANKNSATSIEKKQRAILEKELVNAGIQSIDISETMKLELGWRNVDDEEVDVQKLFKENPNLFWSLCTVSKTALISELGEKGAAKLTRTVKKHVFKLDKIKKPKE